MLRMTDMPASVHTRWFRHSDSFQDLQGEIGISHSHTLPRTTQSEFGIFRKLCHPVPERFLVRAGGFDCCTFSGLHMSSSCSHVSTSRYINESPGARISEQEFEQLFQLLPLGGNLSNFSTLPPQGAVPHSQLT